MSRDVLSLTGRLHLDGNSSNVPVRDCRGRILVTKKEKEQGNCERIHIIVVGCMAMQRSAELGSTDSQGRRERAQELHDRVQGLFPRVEYISYEKFNELMNVDEGDEEKAVLIDVREREEIATGTLDPSVDVKQSRQVLASKDKETQKVICFCTIGVRSGIHADKLSSEGFQHVWNYSIVEHMWGGGHTDLIIPVSLDCNRDGREQWDGSVHIYSSKYENIMPPSLSANGKLKFFSTWTALTKGLWMAPSVLSALAAGGKWGKTQ